MTVAKETRAKNGKMTFTVEQVINAIRVRHGACMRELEVELDSTPSTIRRRIEEAGEALKWVWAERHGERVKWYTVAGMEESEPAERINIHDSWRTLTNQQLGIWPAWRQW